MVSHQRTREADSAVLQQCRCRATQREWADRGVGSTPQRGQAGRRVGSPVSGHVGAVMSLLRMLCVCCVCCVVQADDEVHDFEGGGGESGASHTFPMQAGNLKKNGFAMLKEKPCKVGDVGEGGRERETPTHHAR